MLSRRDWVSASAAGDRGEEYLVSVSNDQLPAERDLLLYSPRAHA